MKKIIIMYNSFLLVLLLCSLIQDIVLRHVDLHPSVPDGPSQSTPPANNSTPIVEDCEGQPASPSYTNPTPPPNSRETPTKKANGRLLTRTKSAGVPYTDQPHPLPQYYSHATPPKPRPSQLHSTVGGMTNSPPTRPIAARFPKQATPSNKHKSSCDKAPIDLMVTSARMVMSACILNYS